MRYFDPVYAREDVDAVGAEDGDPRHVDVVQGAQLEELPEVGLQGDWNDDLGDAEIDKVDDEDGDAGDGRDEEFMPPADVKEVIADSEDYYGLEGENCGEVGC